MRRTDAQPELLRPTDSTLSVRQVNELVRGALARHLPPTLHVLGEIGDLSQPGSGHVYFTLKEPGNELRCVMWRSAAGKLKFTPEVGMQVIATGGVEVYPPRGSYQLVVRKLEPRGVGALEVAFRQLKEKLAREGLFDPSRKKPLPAYPERIAVVTSPTGAAIRDILHTLARRYRAADVLVFPVRVQGEGAAGEIAAAIELANRQAEVLGGVDVLIVGRGGGSLEDLWAFNAEVVARAIVASRIPVVSAVGHEVDTSISDLVADLRAPTPTAAAELVTPKAEVLVEWLSAQEVRLTRTVRHAAELSRARLAALLAYDGLAKPLARLWQHGQLLDEIEQRLGRAQADVYREAREAVGAAEAGLLRFAGGRRFEQARRMLEERVHRLGRSTTSRMLTAERHVARLAARIEKAGPTVRLARHDDQLQQLQLRLASALRSSLVLQRRLLAVRLEAVTACDPRRVLRRGYSLTRDARTRKLIRSLSEIRDKLRIIVEVADGEFRATADDPRQPGLFE